MFFRLLVALVFLTLLASPAHPYGGEGADGAKERANGTMELMEKARTRVAEAR